MRLIIIGLVIENGKLMAYKIYDADSKQTGIYPRENVWYRVREGKLVVGLRVAKDGVVTGVYNSSFNVSKTDILNGKGNPIEESGRYILVGYSGYLEEIKYRLVNSKGYERIVNKDEFMALIDEDKVNGVIKSTRIKDKIILYRHCNHREYSY